MIWSLFFFEFLFLRKWWDFWEWKVNWKGGLFLKILRMKFLQKISSKKLFCNKNEDSQLIRIECFLSLIDSPRGSQHKSIFEFLLNLKKIGENFFHSILHVLYREILTVFLPFIVRESEERKFLQQRRILNWKKKSY